MCRGCACLRDGFWIGWLDLLVPCTHNSELQTRQRYCLSRHFTHSLGLSVFTSRILATDLYQSHYHFKSHMKSSFHTQIPISLLYFNGHFWRLDSIQFLCSHAHIRVSWSLETGLILLNWPLLYNHFARTTHKTQFLNCREGVFTTPLHSNESYSIVACVIVAAGMFLPSSCLAMDVFFDFTIPAFGRHATISLFQQVTKLPSPNRRKTERYPVFGPLYLLATR
jgi:hypothetical protein